MSRYACSLLRHRLVDRWIGDLRATYCEVCHQLWFPEPVVAELTYPTPRPGAQVGGEVGPASGNSNRLAALPAVTATAAGVGAR